MDNIECTIQSEESLDCLRETELLKDTTPGFLLQGVKPTCKAHGNLYMYDTYTVCRRIKGSKCWNNLKSWTKGEADMDPCNCKCVSLSVEDGIFS